MFLDQIVNIINDELVSKLTSVKFNISVHGISKQLLRTEPDDSFPAYVDNTGEGSFNAVDDKFSLCIYHRCLNLSWEEETNLDFGDGSGFTKETASMAVFIYGDRKRLQMAQETVLSIVASSLPSGVSQTFINGNDGLLNGSISAANSPNDSLAAWRQEFQNILYSLPPEQFFLQLNYTIETVIQKDCIEVCSEC